MSCLRLLSLFYTWALMFIYYFVCVEIVIEYLSVIPGSPILHIFFSYHKTNKDNSQRESFIEKFKDKILPTLEAGIFQCEHNTVKNKDFIWISRGILEDDIVWGQCGYFDLNINTSIVANAFCELHNDKYTKYSPHKNFVIRA